MPRMSSTRSAGAHPDHRTRGELRDLFAVYAERREQIRLIRARRVEPVATEMYEEG
jgi:hypothetical protein